MQNEVLLMNVDQKEKLRLIRPNNQQKAEVIENSNEANEEEVFSKIMQAYENRLMSKRLKATYIKSSLNTINTFLEYTNLYPWEWTKEDFDDWSAYIFSIKNNSEATQRRKQGVIARFQHFLVTSPLFCDICVKTFNQRPVEICDCENMIPHKVEDENKEKRDALTKKELKCLWDYFDEQIRLAYNNHSKNLKTLQRDKVLYSFIYHFGLRVQEASMISTTDFIANPKRPEFGNMGGLIVKYGKSSSGSPPKRRVVWVVSENIVNSLIWYLKSIRPQFGFDDTNWLFVSERGTRLSKNSISRNFTEYLKEAGLTNEKYSTHSLRHSYISHLSEVPGVSPRLIQEQVGHSYLATTQMYTHLSDDFISNNLNKVINRQLLQFEKEVF